MTPAATTSTHTETTDPNARIAFADAALALSGHQVTDPDVRDLLARVARDEITGDQAVSALRRHVQS